jgi:hypothetical protein
MIEIADLQGHWRRAWLRAPGVEDHDTAVHWLQVGSIYADIRIPARRPDVRGARALAELPDRTLLHLMRAEGFAGEIALEGDVCTWRREINWHGAPEGVDAGRLRFDDGGALLEDGVHAEYGESWDRIDGAPVHALRLTDGTRLGVLVTVGERFVFGLGRADAPASAPVLEALRQGRRGAGLERHFEGGYAFGSWQGRLGQADLATNPLWESRCILATRGAELEVSLPDFRGETRMVRMTPLPVSEPAA